MCSICHIDETAADLSDAYWPYGLRFWCAKTHVQRLCAISELTDSRGSVAAWAAQFSLHPRKRENCVEQQHDRRVFARGLRCSRDQFDDASSVLT